ncbi:MAG: VTT domain-containing protein [Elusimicrobia bacterium]|nr:VTT domain-containing protein [Elusimicrobiota bacterium]
MEPASAGAAWLLRVLGLHGPGSLFLWGLGKSLVPLPAPSAFVLAGAVYAPKGGVAAVLGWAALRVALPGAAGITIGAYPYYRWGRRGGWPAAARYGPRFGLSAKGQARWAKRLSRRRGPVIIAARALPVVPVILGSILAGLAEATPWEYAAWTFAGALVRCEVLAVLGWAMRESYGDLGWRFRPWEVHIAAGAFLAAAAAFLLNRRRVRRRDERL